MIKLGIIGYGYWGPNLVRNFFSTKDCLVKSVADARLERLDQLAKIFPSINRLKDAQDIINDADIDAVVIATPVFTHFSLARQALMNGKHVLIEKPLTSSVKEAVELIDAYELGSVTYLDSTRINLGLFQPDINVLWDLAPHDISILNYLVKEKPYSINATGVTHTKNNIENIAYLTVNYKSGFIAHFNCSWSSPVKIRMMLIGGDKKMVLYNDLEPTEKIKVYDTGYDHKTDEEKKKVLVDYRTGDIYVPKLHTTEALSGMACDFINCIKQNATPVSSYEIGLNVVKILEASDKSIKDGGREVLIN